VTKEFTKLLEKEGILHKKLLTETSITPVFSPGLSLPVIKKKIKVNILNHWIKKEDFWGLKLAGFQSFLSEGK
jgi:hypothetical protein